MGVGGEVFFSEDPSVLREALFPDGCWGQRLLAPETLSCFLQGLSQGRSLARWEGAASLAGSN